MGQALTIGCALVAATVLSLPADAEEAKRNSPPAAASPLAHDFADIAADRRIEEILDQPLKSPLNFADKPLNQITDSLVEEYGISIRFDPATVDFNEKSPDVKVSIKAEKGSLRNALRKMLDSAELSFFVKDGVLIVTGDEIRCGAVPRVYAVGPLVTAIEMADAGQRRFRGPNATAEKAAIDELIEAIQATVAPDSWRSAGTGDGEIKKIGRSYLVILQASEIHEDIRRLLRELEYEAARQQGPPASESPASNVPVDPFAN